MKKKDAEQDALAKELRQLIPKLDSEGLSFLIKQARVHLYNMQVDELNKAAAQAPAAKPRQGTPSAKGGKLRIAGSESGSSYYLYCGNADVMFSRDEMLRLVKIAGAPGTDLEIRERLYNWFSRERKDVFAVMPMKDKFDEHLKALATLLKKSFKVREA